MDTKRLTALILGSVAMVIVLFMGTKCVCDVGASEIVIRQSLGGDLTVWYDPGWHWQGFGSITRYSRSEQFLFKAPKNDAETEAEKKPPPADAKADPDAKPDPDQSAHIRFSDQGSARLSGSLSFDLPSNEEQMVKLHKKFRSMDGIRDRLVETALQRAVVNSGPFMTSRESAGIRRADLIPFIQDQAARGVYKTTSKQIEVEDLLAPPRKVTEVIEVPVLDEAGKPKLGPDGKPITKQDTQIVERPATRQVMALEPKLDDKGLPVLQESSPLAEYGIRIYNLTLDRILYEPKVQEQINRQRDMEMAIQTKISEAKQAEQNVVTTEKIGQAEAAKAKWDQEVKKAQALTEAEQNKIVAQTKAEQSKSVAQTDLETAKLERQAQVERAKGESESKKLIIEADGALAQKLDAYIQVQKAWAAEIGKQRWVPDVQVGSSGRDGGSAVSEFMQLLGAKSARDLALDLNVKR
jgi:regulator of protease activity HflC (stomatin/prohibitin superfamily)